MKRREFIGNVIKSGSGLLLVSSFPLSNVIAGAGKIKEKLGVALVGLGNYSTGQLGPALLETGHCYLAGIVTGTPEKEKIWSEKYNIPEKNIYNYENFDTIADNKDIDIVYVVLPNSMHAEYTIRAAQAGKHVICEKPMAITVADCQEMIGACKKANKKLSIGYRLHFDPLNLKMMELGQHKVYGNINTISAGFGGERVGLVEWRMDKKMAGGGPLVDLGVYCTQGMIYTIGELPKTVKAVDKTVHKDFFTSVEGTMEWEFEFQSGAKGFGRTSYEEQYCYLTAETEKGIFKLEPSFLYNRNKGFLPDGPMNISEINQQAKQMDAFAISIKEDKESLVPGEMGMRDVYLIEKIYESASSGKTVSLEGIPEILQKV